MSYSTSSLQDNPLLQIKQLSLSSSPSSLRQAATRIYDKKLKSFLSLSTKQQVLQHCQEFLITKTVQYMNAITMLETSQLKILNSLNEGIDEKNMLIRESKRVIEELTLVKKEQEQRLGELGREVQTMTEQLSQTRIKLNTETQIHYKSKIQFQKRNNLLRQQFYSSRSLLQSQLQQLTKALQDKTQQYKSTVMTFKIEINNIKVTKDREILELTRKGKQMSNEFERSKDEMMKEIKYLGNLVEVKMDEISEMKRKEKPIVVANKRVFMGMGGGYEVIIMPVRVEKVEKMEKPETPKVVAKNSKILERLKKSEESRKFDKVVVERGDMMTSTWLNPQLQPVQPPQPQPILIPINPVNPRKTTSGTQTSYTDPFDGKPVTQTQLQLRYYLQQQYQNKYDQTIKNLNRKYQQEYKNTMGVIRTMILQLTSMTKEQIDLDKLRVRQMEGMYCDRPSREEDLDYIVRLLTENRSLIGLCEEANIKTDSAYLALKQYHTKLESYKRLVPMTIVGREDPPHIIHSSHQKQRYESRQGSKDMKTARSQFVRNFNSIASWGLSQPATSRKANRNANPGEKTAEKSGGNARWDDQTFEVTKDVLGTSEFETIDNLSPIRRKSTHSKSNNILSIRKKSGIN